MKFKKQPRKPAKDYELEIIKFWKDNQIFEKSVELRPAEESFVFYDGPPFITGVPHHGTLLSSVVKDAIPRYQTMKGKRVERVWGWDCHGLPAENFVEKKLGIKDKRDVYKIGLETYIKACRESMVQTGSEWEDTIDRIGRWVDFKGSYKTMDASYMESVWWAFKELWQAEKIYEGEKVLLYCTRCATPIAKAEVAMDNSYQDITDPSVFIKFRLTDNSVKELGLQQENGLDVAQGSTEKRNESHTEYDETSTAGADKAIRQKHQQVNSSANKQVAGPVFLLAWTTTPWTLIANTATAVNAGESYAQVKVNGQSLILAEKLLDKVLTNEKHQPIEYEIEYLILGKDLVGKHYEPLFKDRGKGAHQVLHADYVSLEEGTGIVHLAPAYGEEDYELAQQNDVPIISVIDENGLYTEGPWQGQLVWDVNKPIAKALMEEGKLLKLEYYRHSYPHCHRCGTKLMYRAHPSWFMNIADQRQQMLNLNGNINWFPPHIKKGRFAKTVENAPDWNISRDRFWATPMPVWKATDKDGKELVKVVGSYDELEELSGKRLDDYHRPWVDEISFDIDGLTYKRIDKVMDSWFEAGSMPYAQFHYPFENKEKFEANFPGDFIAEYVGQVRAWFYYLHALSTGLFDKNSYNNVIVTGTIAGNDGRKMSKSYGNYTDPNVLMNTYSADALRMYFLGSPLLNGEDVSMLDKDVSDIHRKLTMLWNINDFFTTYAEVDGWQWNGRLDDPSPELTNVLDIWAVSRLHQVIKEVEDNLDTYNIPKAVKPILDYIEELSNWFVRRSRKRFWKSDNDTDKDDAYKTLHYCMVQLCKVLAPFTPFISEAVYKQLTNQESVHLTDWPQHYSTSHLVLEDMAKVRELITEGLAKRSEAKIKVRQPLTEVSFNTQLRESSKYLDIFTEELNVKEVKWINSGATVSLNTKMTPTLVQEGISRELIRLIQNARKNAGLNVDDRINLSVKSTSKDVLQAFKTYQKTIFSETLAVGDKTVSGHSEQVNLDGAEITIELSKA